MMVCHITPSAVTGLLATRAEAGDGGMPRLPAAMKVFNKCTELMPMIAIASFTLRTDAFTWLNHSGWSG